MSGAEAPLIGAAVGSGVGLLTNKKNPLQGALMGAGLGAAGGKFLPGMLPGLGGAAGSSPLSGLLSGPAALAESPAAISALTPGITSGSEQAAMLAAQNQGLGLSGLLSTAEAGGNSAIPMLSRAGSLASNPAVGLGARMMSAGNEQPQQMPMPAPMMSQPRQQAAAPFSSLMPQDPYMQGYLNPQMGQGFQIGRGWRG